MLSYTIGLSVLLFIQQIVEATIGEVPKTQKEIVEHMRRNGIIKSEKVAKAMREVDLLKFGIKYDLNDTAIFTLTGKITGSAHMYAVALEILKDHLKEGGKSMDLGCDKGYLAACMATIIGVTGKVVGVEYSLDEVFDAKFCIGKANPSLLIQDCLEIVEGEEDEFDFPPGPYDAIHVGDVYDVVPEELLNALKIGGRLMIPVAGNKEYIVKVCDKLPDGTVSKSTLYRVPYI